MLFSPNKLRVEGHTVSDFELLKVENETKTVKFLNFKSSKPKLRDFSKASNQEQYI